jgi:hypothetical protein
LGFVDSDDWIDSDMYEYLYNGIIDNNADIALCRILYQFENKTSYYFNDLFSTEEKMLDGDKLLKYLLLNKIDASCCTKLFKSSIFDKISFKAGRNNEDFNLLYQVFPYVTKGIYINDVAYNYIIRNGSITSSINSSYTFDSYENAKEMLDFIKIHKPDLILEAESYYYLKTYAILRHIVKHNLVYNFSEKYKILRMNLLENKRIILMNTNISNKLKVLILMQMLVPKIQNSIINMVKSNNLG